MKLITEPEYQAFVYKWQNIETGEYYIGVHIRKKEFFLERKMSVVTVDI